MGGKDEATDVAHYAMVGAEWEELLSDNMHILDSSVQLRFSIDLS